MEVLFSSLISPFFEILYHGIAIKFALLCQKCLLIYGALVKMSAGTPASLVFKHGFAIKMLEAIMNVLL